MTRPTYAEFFVQEGFIIDIIDLWFYVVSRSQTHYALANLLDGALRCKLASAQWVWLRETRFYAAR